MKTLLLLCFFIGAIPLHSVSYLDLNSGISFPDGLLSGIKIATDSFNTELEFSFSDECLEIDTFYFNSDIISLGSIGFSGFLKDQKYENFHFFSFDEKSSALINKKGNPESNMGVLFFLPSLDGGISGFRTEDFSQILLWTNFSPYNFLEIHIKQSFSFNENPEQSETWYVEDSIFQSSILSSSSLSIMAGNKHFFVGGSLHLSGAPDDQPGISISPIVGISISDLLIHNELTINSPAYTTPDLKISSYPFVYHGKISIEKTLFNVDNEILFYFERPPFPGENRLWSFSIDSEYHYEKSLLDFKGGAKVKLYNDKVRSLLFSVSISAALKKTIGEFYIDTGGIASYEELFFYRFYVKTGFENRSFEARILSEIEIDNKILINGALSLVIFHENFDFSASFSLENIGLYNCESLKLKPSFFIGVELKQIALQ